MHMAEVSKIISENLQRICAERGWSLRQVAKLSGVNTTTLAQIAKGDGNPTINVLLKITTALKIPYTALIEEQKKEVTVVRKNERVLLVGENPAYQIFNYFSYSAHRNFELFYVTLAPRSKSESSGHTAKAQEYIFMIRGTLRLTVNGTTFVAEEQDSLYFASSSSHTYENATDTEIQFMVINYYP